MKSKLASNALKVLLFLFSLGAIFVGGYVLPTIASQFVITFPELATIKLPVLLISESLIILLVIGIIIIMYLLMVFDSGDTFSLKFTKGLEILFWLCLIASGLVIILHIILSLVGGPGPLLSLVMIGGIFIILIVATVIMLIKAIVSESITYKTDYDLTV